MKPKAKRDLTGLKFGKLTVKGISTVRTPNGVVMWNCLCDCGKKIRVRTASLNNGNTKSCGCMKINNLCGINNYQAQRMIKDFGIWINSKDPWYVRGVQIWTRIKKEKIPTDFESAVEIAAYIREISPKKCPVFGVPLVTGTKAAHDWSPSTDKILPEKGYVRGNIQVISMLANKMKQNASPKQLKQFAQWVLKEQ